MGALLNTPRNTVKPLFIVNKYRDINGSRVNQSTTRGAFCYRDTSGRMQIPRTAAEANKAVTPVDWAKPLNPGPYFNNADGLNGSPFNAFSDGSLGSQEGTYDIDPNLAYSTAWPAAITIYEVPPLFYNQPVPSGAKCLIYDDESVLTYGSGNYDGYVTDFAIGSKVYASYNTGKYGQVTATSSGVTTAIGVVVGIGDFGDQTVTIKTRGLVAL